METELVDYEECLGLTFRDLESWLIVFAGLGFALVLRKFAMPRAAVALAVAAVIGGLSWAYIFYEINCVELFVG